LVRVVLVEQIHPLQAHQGWLVVILYLIQLLHLVVELVRVGVLARVVLEA
jgi:hypothetical protein